MIKVDLSGAAEFFDAAGPDYAAAAKAHRALTEGTGAGAAFTGWLHNAARFSNGEMKAVLTAARRTRSRSQALVVIGIGGSYLGAKGAIELLRPIQSPDAPEILFAGTNLSPDALSDLVTRLGNRDFEINIISKSGGTLEPALAFRFFRELLRKKYGPAAAKRRITATTDAAKGRLRAMAEAEGWECFTIPDDIGGRYSVLSAVGLFPMAVAGIDIEQVLLRAVLPLYGGVVEAAVRRIRGQKRYRHLPGLRRIHSGSPLHGPVYPGRPPPHDGNRGALYREPHRLQGAL